MISTTSKLALALGVAGAIALTMSTAEARTKRNAPKAQTSAQGQVVNGPSASQPFSSQRSYRGSYGYLPAPAGGGINFKDGRAGANYDPNQ